MDNLIKYLEDEIKKRKESINILGKTLDDYFEHEYTIDTMQIQIGVYQEILDKINKNNFKGGE